MSDDSPNPLAKDDNPEVGWFAIAACSVFGLAGLALAIGRGGLLGWVLADQQIGEEALRLYDEKYGFRVPIASKLSTFTWEGAAKRTRYSSASNPATIESRFPTYPTYPTYPN